MSTDEKVVNEASELGNNQENERKKKQKRTIVTIILLLLLLLLSLLVLNRLGYIQFPWEQERMIIGNAQRGDLRHLSDEELLEEMQRQADESGVRVQINSMPVFESGESQGSLFLGNPESNALDMHVEIHLEETGELIYESGLIPSGYYIEKDYLIRPLKKGNHVATANITYYDGTEVRSRSNFKIEIVVKS